LVYGNVSSMNVIGAQIVPSSVGTKIGSTRTIVLES
jgi:hypothetical protein